MAIPNNTLRLPDKLSKTKENLGSWIKAHKALFDIFLDAYCIVDLENNVVDFNVAFTELCGESYRKVKKIKKFNLLLETELGENDSPANQIIKKGKALRLDEIRGSSAGFPELTLIFGGVPIFDASGEMLGALLTIRNVSAEDELQKKYLERKAESITDGLTRLYNKVYAEDSLLRLVKNSLRTINSFSVCMLDIDHFKKVNDTFGHQAGDYVLSMVAQLLKGEVRGSDIVGRFGGEEFIAILANSTVTGAHRFAERFRNRVAITEMRFQGQLIPITVSIGTSTFNEKWRMGLNPEASMKQLVSRADKALYQAKENGRNRTCQFETLPED